MSEEVEVKEVEVKDDESIVSLIKKGQFSQIQNQLEDMVAKKLHDKIKEKMDLIKNNS